MTLPFLVVRQDAVALHATGLTHRCAPRVGSNVDQLGCARNEV